MGPLAPVCPLSIIWPFLNKNCHKGANGHTFYGHKYGQIVFVIKDYKKCRSPDKKTIQLLFLLKS